jgi:adenylosuccinate lyase
MTAPTTVAGSAEDCAHERGHITDSRLYGNRYATPASREIYCDTCRNQRWLDVEAALAVAQGELGMIPAEVVAPITTAARLEHIDLDAVQAETERSGHSLVGLLRVFQRACPGRSGEYIHFGATTQDIQDTGQALEMRDTLDELDRELTRILECLTGLAEAHADTVAVGRTHARAALPMSFGLKIASWIDEILRHAGRLRTVRERVLVAQLFGGAGTMAGFGADGIALLERFAALLGLGVPTIGWHVARDRVVEYVTTLAMISGTLGRIADEVRTIGRPEFGEVSEPWHYGKVGSSTMPHKRNPERCEQVVVMAKLAAAQAGIAFAGMMGDHERDSRTLRVEWACVPDVSHYTLSAAAIMGELLAGMTVHVDRLRSNTREVADQLASERLMLALGARIGKQTAHERVYELSQRAYEDRRSLRELLDQTPDLAVLLEPDEVARIFDPAQYLGASALLTHRAVAEARKWLDEHA